KKVTEMIADYHTALAPLTADLSTGLKGL
ncbi:hypothetical protein ABH930_007409, partial [Kitasatospora sp. GAS204A]